MSSAKSLDFSHLYIVVTRGNEKGEEKLAKELEQIRQQIQPESHRFKIHRCALLVGDVLIGYLNPDASLINQSDAHDTDRPTLSISLKTLTDENLSDSIPQLLPLLLIERKDIPDFVKSFKTSHYQNQKTRMISFRDQTGCPCALVVERYYDAIDLGGNCCREKVSTLESAFTSIQLRDHFFLKHVNSVSQHAEYIYKCLRTIVRYKLWEGHHYHNPEKIQGDYTNSIQIKKKGNLTPELCYQVQLNAVPGVSMPMAEAIAQAYPNWESLIKVLKLEGPNSTENPNVPNPKPGKPTPKKYILWSLKELSAGTQKLGPVKARRLYDYILQTST